MLILLDNIIYSLQTAGGISTYWQELTRRVLRDELPVSFLEFPNCNVNRKEIDIPQSKVLNIQKYPILVERFRQLALKSYRSNFIFHSSYNRVTSNPNALQVITIHDFVHEKYYSGTRQILHSYLKNRAIKSANKIITVSENTKTDLLERFPNLSPTKIKVIYNGVSDCFFPIDSVETYSTQKPFLLYVGSREHYKNFTFAIKVLKELKDFDLYIVGSPLNDIESSTLNSNIADRFKVFTAVNPSKLNELYNSAFALLYPSSYEGFGIPLLEAMKCGTPFLALRRSSIPEVAGDAGILIDQLDIDAFTSAIMSIDLDREKLRAKGFNQVKKFSWEKSFQETIKVYNELYNNEDFNHNSCI
ncbi:glycosyltransferase family 4 protein [Desertivirga brevis]|uniref:glycosyltransferase family 4 protein n=1 Tax=Desertivirga brevis TaxID=2810310 RepID=UPI001A961D04|nr:glycosyltransferase family 1 protein [Pedobacter sp. SYSU D00873]